MLVYGLCCIADGGYLRNSLKKILVASAKVLGFFDMSSLDLCRREFRNSHKLMLRICYYSMSIH